MAELTTNVRTGPQTQIEGEEIDVHAAKTDLVMSVVTGPQHTEVGKPSRSGTCMAVHQEVVDDPESPGTRQISNICMQSELDRKSCVYAQFPVSNDVEEIKKYFCSTGAAWEDDFFPASTSSIYSDDVRPEYIPEDITWLRPWEITPDAKLITDGTTRFDINQGRIGNCWFISAVAGLTSNQELFDKVLPPGQSLDKTQDYNGSISFRFYIGGEWKDLVIDDRLPTWKGKLLFLRSNDPQEFWPSLIEKAFAKICGCYNSLTGGTFGEASSYFGGLTENFNIRGPYLDGLDPVFVKERLLEAASLGSLCGAAVYDLGSANSNSYSKWGLPSGHEYTLTGFTDTQIRVRNPWGGDIEWAGQKSDADGEFWMDWLDFMTHFHQVQVAHYDLNAASGFDEKNKKSWKGQKAQGEWTVKTAGGCPNFPSFRYNKQYQLTVGSETSSNVHVLIALDQISAKRKQNGMEKHPVGFIVYKSTPNQKLSKETLKSRAWVADSGLFRYEKQIVGRYTLPPGTYTIIPCTFFPGLKAKFLLRIFHSQEDTNLVSLNPVLENQDQDSDKEDSDEEDSDEEDSDEEDSDEEDSDEEDSDEEDSD